MNSPCCILNVKSGYYGHYGSFASRGVGTSYYGGEIYFYVQSTFMYPRQGYLQPQSKFICMQLKWSHYISLGTTNDLIVNSFAYLYVLGG